MGGGGVMRTAAKVAGIGAANASLRGMPLAPPAEQSVRKASRPVSAVVSSQAAKPAEVAPLHTAASWETDDWEFADDGLVMDAGEPTPRLVFSGVPSFQEAKDATSELKDAIDKLYLSSNSSDCGSSAGSQVSVLSPAHMESETKSCVIEAAPLVVPNHALQAFKLLSGSTEAQTVVASIASDPKVWNAVMDNPVLKDYFQSQQNVAGFEAEKSSNLEDLSDSVSVDEAGDQKPGFDLFSLLQNIKLTVAEMVSGVSNFLQNIFGFAGADKTTSGDNGNTKGLFADQTVLGGTFIGLVVLVAMVVLVRRV